MLLRKDNKMNNNQMNFDPMTGQPINQNNTIPNQEQNINQQNIPIVQTNVTPVQQIPNVQSVPSVEPIQQVTPIQTQQRLIKELENAKSREDFSRITQEMKNLPKTEEYQAVRQRLGAEQLQRYNEWKANLPESTRAIKNMVDIKKEDIIAKYCSENGLVTNDILSIFNKCTKDLDDASVERLLELASENKINLFSSQKEKKIFSLKRHCKEHS